MATRPLDNKFINLATTYILFVVVSLLLVPLLILKLIYQNILFRFHAKEENVKGKVILITGASSGIGEYVAYEYAKRGAFLAIVARREERLRKVANKARAFGSPDVLPLTADVSKIDDCKRFIDQTINHFGRLDHLVNNAGITNMYSVDDGVEVTKFAPVMDINFWGNVYPTYYAIPHLKKTKGKVIVNGSAAGYLNPPQMAFYAASKAAIVSFYEAIRVQLSPEIKVMTIILGLVESEMTQGKQLTKDGVVGVTQEGNFELQGIPLMSTEPCAKAIVQDACRGARYSGEPQYIRVWIMLNFLFPELLQWCYRTFFPANSTTSKDSAQQLSSKRD